MTQSRSSSSSNSRASVASNRSQYLTCRVNITAVIITFVSAVASNSETSVLTAVQLLWVNLCVQLGGIWDPPKLTRQDHGHVRCIGPRD